MKKQLLKLAAQDGDDVAVVSAVLQDAIAPLCDMSYQTADGTFIMVVHRFCWCDGAEVSGQPQEKEFERICSAVSISGVKGVHVQGVDQGKRGQMLDLLALLLNENHMDLIFAGNAKIRLDLADWRLRLEDFGEPWPTSYQPKHG